MDLSDQELRELALFFAKRMGTDLRALDPLDPPPPGDPRQAWFDKLHSAQRDGSLVQLARKLRGVDPDDENLQSACEILITPGARLESYALGAAMMGGAALLLLSITGAGGFLAVASALEAREPQAVAVLQPQPSAEAAAIAAPLPTVFAASIPDPVPDPAPEVEELVASAPAPPVPAVAPSRCTAAEGGLVGYWYAGEAAPGRAGEVVKLPHAVNVRADYPDVHNNFDARAQVKCVLQPGDELRLSKSPIRVPADRYWVPLVSGDLVIKPA